MNCSIVFPKLFDYGQVIVRFHTHVIMFYIFKLLNMKAKMVVAKILIVSCCSNLINLKPLKYEEKFNHCHNRHRNDGTKF